LKALAFLAGDEVRFGRFLQATGTAPQDLRKLAQEPQFLAGLMDYFLSDQTLLILFADSEGFAVESVVAARGRLPGASRDF
jgi:hypothetical protein